MKMGLCLKAAFMANHATGGGSEGDCARAKYLLFSVL